MGGRTAGGDRSTAGRGEPVGAALVGDLTRLDLVRIGALMYWCEGTKAQRGKGAGGERVVFTNSDAGLILVFLAFLRVMGVARADIGFRVAIHETADVDAAVRWWADLVGVAPERFARTTLKRSRPSTNRRKTGSNYRGRLVVTVCGGPASCTGRSTGSCPRWCTG